MHLHFFVRNRCTLQLQEYDATCLISKYHDVSRPILIDQVSLSFEILPESWYQWIIFLFFDILLRLFRFYFSRYKVEDSSLTHKLNHLLGWQKYEIHLRRYILLKLLCLESIHEQRYFKHNKSEYLWVFCNIMNLSGLNIQSLHEFI